MKMKLSTLEVVKKTKGKMEYVSIFKETPDGLFIVNVERDSENLLIQNEIEKKYIGNFFLRLVKEDRNRTENKHDWRIKYWFSIYYIHPKNKKIVKSLTQFYYIRGEKLTKKIEERLPANQAILEFTDSKFLGYFEMYIRELIKKETKEDSHLLVNNEEITGYVKEYIVASLDLINGQEKRYIESSFNYSIIQNQPFYDANMIWDNQSLFLYYYNHKQEYLKAFEIPYEKIGFIEPCTCNKPAYLYIHLPSLKKLREKERFAKEMTTQKLNIGLRKLGLIVSTDGRNTTNLKNRKGDISMNLTRLDIDKLEKLYIEIQKENDDMCKRPPIIINPKKEEIFQQNVANQQNLDINENCIALVSGHGIVIYNKFNGEIKECIPNNSSYLIAELLIQCQEKGCGIVKEASTKEEIEFIKQETNKARSQNSITNSVLFQGF